MAKTLKEAPITTRAARAKLPVRPYPYWRAIDPDTHLGYLKSSRGGTWQVRRREGKGYKREQLGTADDEIAEGTLDYRSAIRAARARVEAARAEARAAAEGPPLTVRLAVEAYIAARDARESKRAGRAKRSDAGQRLGRYVIGQPARGKRAEVQAAALAEIGLHELKEKDLLRWRESLPDKMKATTRQRLVNDLKAALNAAYAGDRERLDPSLPAIIKHGLRAVVQDDEGDPVARDNQILTDAEISRLLSAARETDKEQGWDGDLFRLVLVLAATGARFSQVVRMRVGDGQIAAGRLLVPVSRKGRGGKTGSIAVPVGRDVMDALVPVLTDRPADAPLLERWRSEQMKGGIAWQRTSRGAWHAGAELARPWRAIRERAKMPDVIPYALRHSSIVKGIRANLPIRLVAAIHDTSTTMIERHYSKWITSGLEEMARAAIVPLVPGVGDNVVSIGKRA